MATEEQFSIELSSSELNFILGSLKKRRQFLKNLLEYKDVLPKDRANMEASLERMSDVIHSLLRQRAAQRGMT